jgi:hypothetical protein
MSAAPESPDFKFLAPVVGIFPIAALPPFFFWCTAKSIGSTNEESIAFFRNELKAERVEELRVRTQTAANSLRQILPANWKVI